MVMESGLQWGGVPTVGGWEGGARWHV